MGLKLPTKASVATKAATAAVAAKAAKILPREALTVSRPARGAIIANMISILILLILFLWTAASRVFDIQAKDDKNARWWDLNLIYEEEAALKIVADMAFLLVASGLLFVRMRNVFHSTKGVYNRFNLGALVASMFMFGNMLFVSFWYLINFGTQDNDGKNNKEYDQYEQEQGYSVNELALHHRAVTATLCFIMAATFCTLSYFLYKEGKNLPEKGHGSNTGFVNNDDRIKGGAHMEIFLDIWKYLSYTTIGVFIIIYICTCILLGGQAMEDIRQEGLLFNLVSVLGWVMILTAGMIYAGRKILRENKMDGTLGVGLILGGTIGYSLLCLLVCILYANPALKEHKNEADGEAPAIATSFACFFSFLSYFAFSVGVYKYQSSIIGAALEGVDLEAEDVEMGEPTGNFARMEDEAEAKADDSTAGDFQRMEDEPADDNSAASSTLKRNAVEPKSEVDNNFKITDSEDTGTVSSKPAEDEPQSSKDDDDAVIV